jgi:hypothetical protein
MRTFKWNKEKDDKLKKERGVSFEDIINARFITAEVHKKRSNQLILIFEYDNYIWAVPCVEENGRLFLKTAYPSRKHTKEHLRGD